MTYCLGVKLKDGFIGISDTRITSGSATTTSKKVYTVNRDHHAFFIMTSGLRSVRDKAMTYFKEVLETEEPHNKLYKVVNAFATEVRRVAKEDKEGLEEAGLHFNLYSIIGGQLSDDHEHKMYLLYPEGNWIEVSEGTPFSIIGNSGYGKPILDRILKYDSSMNFALKAGFLSFDATRISANDVDYPIDVVYYKKDSFNIIEKRFTKDELQTTSREWSTRLKAGIDSLSDDWMRPLFDELDC